MFVWMNICTCIMCVSSTYRGQKEALKLQVCMRHHMGAGNQTQSLCKNSNCSLIAESFFQTSELADDFNTRTGLPGTRKLSSVSTT